MEQLIQEVREWLTKKYSQNVIDYVGLSEDEDIIRILKDHLHLENYNYKNFISDYVNEQMNYLIMSYVEE